MSAPGLNGPFTMPMFREFVPRKVQPWLYVFMAITFQLSGGLYLGSLSHMMGETALMREDLLMCLYANLGGMAIYFPLLFRMKFRFSNRFLLTMAAAGVLLCNLIAPHVRFLPLLWLLCFIEGICKLQGTFECMSNIQLWITPKRDFSVFFPVLHIIILGCMQLSGIITTNLMYYYHWSYMHLFIAGLMLVDLVIIWSMTRAFRVAKRLPLYGIDWLGAILWVVLLLEIAYLFDYGNFYDWWNSPTIQWLTVAIVITAIICIWRMLAIRHPYFEPQLWKYKKIVPIMILITLVEIILASERVLEEVFYEDVMHYTEMVSVRLDWPTLVGCLTGCVFSLWWMHVKRFNYLRLLIIGIAGLILYLMGFYFLMSPEIHISQLYLPIFFRGFAYAVLSATFMVCLEEITTFQHFFQSLSVFNMLHMVMGGVIGGALYSEGLSYYVADNFARYGAAIDKVSAGGMAIGPHMEEFVSMVMQVSVKQLYGWILYGTILLFLLFLLYDTPVRRELKMIPAWKSFRNEVAKPLKHLWRRERRKAAAPGN